MSLLLGNTVTQIRSLRLMRPGVNIVIVWQGWLRESATRLPIFMTSEMAGSIRFELKELLKTTSDIREDPFAWQARATAHRRTAAGRGVTRVSLKRLATRNTRSTKNF